MTLTEWIDAGKPNDVIVNCDCLSHLKAMDTGSINCLVTSPPYWGLRDYGTTPLVSGGRIEWSDEFQYEIVPGKRNVKIVFTNEAKDGLR